MARSKRICRPGLIYHVINRGNNRQVVFLEKADYEMYLGLLYRFKIELGFKLFAYCLMANHIHLLIKTSEKQEKANISRIMQKITNAHTRHYHFKYQTSGHVWQGRFKSPIVSDDQYLLDSMSYIENNPVKAKIVGVPGDYQWSSFKLNVRVGPSKLIDREANKVFCALGKNVHDRIRAYRKKIQEKIDKVKLEKLEKSLAGHSNFISEKFEKQIAEMLPKRRRRGRPRKRDRLAD